MLKNFAHGRCHQGVGANRLHGPTPKTVAYCICMRSEFKRLPNKFANCRCMQSVCTCNQTVGTSLRFSYSIELPWTCGLILSQIDFFEKPVSKKAKSLLISDEYRSLIFHPNSTKLSGNVQLLQKPLLTNFGEIWKKNCAEQSHHTQFACNDSWPCSILAKAKNQLRQGYLSRRLGNKAAKQPRYLNSNMGQVLGGCPRVHHIPCTSARGCLFPSLAC